MSDSSARIVGYGETEKHRPRSVEERAYSLEEYFQRAARLTLDDAGIDKDDVDGLGVIRTIAGTPFAYPGMLAETLGFDIKYLFSEDLGGASAIALLSQSVQAIEAGHATTILCLGADTPICPDADSEALFPRDPRGYIRNYKDPHGVQGPNANIALVQNKHMAAYGTTRKQLAKIAAVHRSHALRNPNGYFEEAFDIDDYLNAEMIADPVCLLDCVIPVNGGYGFLVTGDESLLESDADPVTPVGFGQRHNPEITQRRDVTTTGIRTAAKRAFDEAGLGHDSVDFVQVYDDYPIIVLMQLEDIGFCEKGMGGKFVQSTDLRYDGEVPVNTSGGQLSSGQAGLAGGFEHLVEAIRQLKGEATNRQVRDATHGLVTGVGGIAFDKNLRSTATCILSRGEEA